MFELIKLKGNTYYIESPAKIGVYLSGTEVYLIDSGNDKDAGRKIRKLLEEKCWHLRGIVNTHSNADHIGGNAYLAKQTQCGIYANGIERAFTRWPILETSFLYGGYPPKDLRHKFLLAAESPAQDFSADGFPQELIPVDLPGHFFHMVGFRTPDDVVFLADCLSSREILDKYHISFIYNVEEYLQTLDKVEAMKAAIFVPSHAAVTSDIIPLVQYNRAKVMEIGERIYGMCRTPLIFEEILKQIFDVYSLQLNFEQYVLVGSTLRSYLSWLRDAQKINVEFDNNRLYWRCI